MSRAETLYLIPYLISLSLSLSVAPYTWRRRNAKGVTAYFWYVTGQTLWVFGFIIELLSHDIDRKIFWDGTQWLAGFIIVIAFPIFAIQYTEHKIDRPQRYFRLSLIFPILFTFVLMTDSVHHLIYNTSYTLIPTKPFSELTYDFTWAIYAYAVYSYIILFWGVGLLIRRIRRVSGLYRTQLAVIIFGFLIPILATVLTTLGIQITP